MACGRLIFLMGPTASGKTAVAAELSRRIACEIVNVDSALIYKGMDIGTAKPGAAARAQTPHHLLDIRDPAQSYSAAAFCRDAAAAVRDIQARGRVPLLAGGTMFYFHALEHGLAAMPGADPSVRGALEARARREGLQSLHDELQRLDPASAARIHPMDSQRVQRALEVCLSGGRPFSQWQRAAPRAQPPLAGRIHRIGLDCADRARLHRRIERRFDAMLGDGLLDEVAGLMLRGDLDLSRPSMRAVGYRQAWKHLCGHCDFAEMRLRAVCATRQLAKKQLTWMRRMPNLQVHYSDRSDWARIAAQIAAQTAAETEKQTGVYQHHATG